MLTSMVFSMRRQLPGIMRQGKVKTRSHNRHKGLMEAHIFMKSIEGRKLYDGCS